MASPTRRALYRTNGWLSLCRGKRIKNPNRCKKVKGCKVASGKKRTYCRKKKTTRYTRRA